MTIGKKPKKKIDKTQKCKCGKFMPIIPYYCSVCKKGSMKGIKIEIVNLGGITLPSGIKVK